MYSQRSWPHDPLPPTTSYLQIAHSTINSPMVYLIDEASDFTIQSSLQYCLNPLKLTIKINQHSLPLNSCLGPCNVRNGLSPGEWDAWKMEAGLLLPGCLAVSYRRPEAHPVSWESFAHIPGSWGPISVTTESQSGDTSGHPVTESVDGPSQSPPLPSPSPCDRKSKMLNDLSQVTSCVLGHTAHKRRNQDLYPCNLTQASFLLLLMPSSQGA
ncbi:PREDICTED: uncharacterized protein LOC106148650 [Chinchilla lanigera]|uniref:uncharacterized protein LOC106148650 n=1 Tax=Chinchilla lanigera TaxID=34839 RepID=UPI0006981C7B|nr:PREDICTED: uncharacterized protein LOC106148650 [Chinchilla lanigera]